MHHTLRLRRVILGHYSLHDYIRLEIMYVTKFIEINFISDLIETAFVLIRKQNCFMFDSGSLLVRTM